ncbi:MAG: hypothetical protein A2804_03010 [Candidatus Pacebacteria bacterium RIFCSPHIGHO2_01_FULL_46_10]|nr:MAG: hypothetical protein A2804_03010 [Candidatus Pacebacteria bacterium RIFCSPHIGHO2_01_FULL_46_10]
MGPAKTSVRISVILPSYNEMQNISRGVLDEVYTYLEKQSYSWEIVLTDDGSTDGTLDALYAFEKTHDHVMVLNNPHQGKGPTVASGMLVAHGKLRLFSDFDQATPIHEVERLLPFFDDGYDIVIGSREVQGARREKEPFHRHIMGKGFNLFVKLFTVRGIQDTQCGFKMFTDQAAKTLFPMLSVYKAGNVRGDAFTGAFDVELLYIAKKKNLKIAEVPVFWKHIKTNRVDPIKDSTRMLIDLVKIRFSDMLGAYSETRKQ